MSEQFLPWPVLAFGLVGPGTVVARFATQEEAALYAGQQQDIDSDNIYAYTVDPEEP